MFNLDPNKAIAVLSGGLDSTAALYEALSRDIQVVAAVGFNYGQRHVKELEYAKRNADRMGIEYHVIDLTGLTKFLGVSSLIGNSDKDIPEGHYAEESMASTVVPNRNMIMLSIVTGMLPKYNASILITGVHGGDHFIYPDCRPVFFDCLIDTLAASLDNMEVKIFTPFMDSDKAAAAKRGVDAGMVLSETWSCYKGGAIHCGRCGTCVERLEAIEAAGLTDVDETVYEDREFWKTATKEN